MQKQFVCLSAQRLEVNPPKPKPVSYLAGKPFSCLETKKVNKAGSVHYRLAPEFNYEANTAVAPHLEFPGFDSWMCKLGSILRGRS